MVKKLMEVFDRYVAAINKLGSKFDFYKMAKPLEAAIADVGLTMKSNEYFGRLFDVLADPRLKLNLDWESQLKPFISVLPDGWKKRNLTDEMVIRYVPPKEWGVVRDSSWVTKMGEASKLKDRLAAHLIKAVTVTTIERDNDGENFTLLNLTISAGDLTHLLEGIDTSEDEIDIGDALDEIIGPKIIGRALDDAIWKKLKNTPNLEGIEVHVDNWPNYKQLKDAKYEVEMKLHFKAGTEMVMDLEKIVTDFFKTKEKVTSSVSREAITYLAKNNKWYYFIANREYGAYPDGNTYGPFPSEDKATKHMMDNHSNPGMVETDDSGNMEVPKVVKFVKAAVDDVRSQIAGLASGTLARLFKTNKYAEIEKMHEGWLDWWDIQIKAQHKGYTWQDAWQDYEATVLDVEARVAVASAPTKKQLKIAITASKGVVASHQDLLEEIEGDKNFRELAKLVALKQHRHLKAVHQKLLEYVKSSKWLSNHTYTEAFQEWYSDGGYKFVDELFKEEGVVSSTYNAEDSMFNHLLNAYIAKKFGKTDWYEQHLQYAMDHASNNPKNKFKWKDLKEMVDDGKELFGDGGEGELTDRPIKFVSDINDKEIGQATASAAVRLDGHGRNFNAKEIKDMRQELLDLKVASKQELDTISDEELIGLWQGETGYIEVDAATADEKTEVKRLLALLSVSLESVHESKMLLSVVDVNKFSREDVVRILELAIDIRNTVQWIEAEADEYLREISETAQKPTAEEVTEEVLTTIKKYFPNSMSWAQGRTPMFTNIRVTFAYARDKSQLASGILENDPALHVLSIDGFDRSGNMIDDKLRAEMPRGGRISVKPAKGSHMAMDAVRVGWANKSGTPDQVFNHIDKYFAKLKALIATHEDNLVGFKHKDEATGKNIFKMKAKEGARTSAKVH